MGIVEICEVWAWFSCNRTRVESADIEEIGVPSSTSVGPPVPWMNETGVAATADSEPNEPQAAAEYTTAQHRRDFFERNTEKSPGKRS